MMSNQTIAPQASALMFPAASPLCSFKQQVGVTDVEISYSRPGMKGRKVFGWLVPYGALWRTGADYATKLSLSTAVRLNGHEIAAGTYSILSIPGEDEWTIILNRELKPRGTSRYDASLDVLRLQVKPTSLDSDVENLRIEIEPVSETSASLDIVWERTKVSVKIEVDFIDELASKISAVMDSDQEEKPYYQAALFFLDHGKDLKRALEWIDVAIARYPVYSYHFTKARILAELGDTAAALILAKDASEAAKKANYPGFAARVDEFIARYNEAK